MTGVAQTAVPLSLTDRQRKVLILLAAGKTTPTPVLISFDRKSERYLTVVKVGKEPVQSPDVEVHKAWIPVATQVLTREMAEAVLSRLG